MSVLQDTIQYLAQEKMTENPFASDMIGSSRIYYSGKKNPAKFCAMVFTGLSREDRLVIISQLIDRQVTSMKDMYVAEALAITELKNAVRRFYKLV